MLADHRTRQKDVEADREVGGLWRPVFAAVVLEDWKLFVDHMVAEKFAGKKEVGHLGGGEHVDVDAKGGATLAQWDQGLLGSALDELDDRRLLPELAPIGVLGVEGRRSRIAVLGRVHHAPPRAVLVSGRRNAGGKVGEVVVLAQVLAELIAGACFAEHATSLRL